MKKAIWIIVFVLNSVLLTGQSLSPTVVATNGADFSASGHKLSFTVGELAVTTVKNSPEILSQGFQQGPMILFGKVKEYVPTVNVSVFPNPFSDYVNVSLESDQINECYIEVYNIYGQEVMPAIQLQLDGFYQNHRIDLSKLPKGPYLLRVIDKENQNRYSDIRIIKVR